MATCIYTAEIEVGIPDLALVPSVIDASTGLALAQQPAYTLTDHLDGTYSYYTSAMPLSLLDTGGRVDFVLGSTVMQRTVIEPVRPELWPLRYGMAPVTGNDPTAITAYKPGDASGSPTGFILHEHLASGAAPIDGVGP